MSSPLALAAVTAVLRDLLNEGLIDNDLAPIGTFSVSALPPDRIQTGVNEENRLNLFLYQVTPNLGWRNEALPSRGPNGSSDRLTNPPLALDLHYMLTAYGREDMAAEILLGYAMELLHDMPILSRRDIRRSLNPTNPVNVALIPDDGQGRRADDLADQIEQVKITPNYLSADELARLWTAMQSRYRPTMAYQVSTVLIQSRLPTRSPLPVLTRGEADRGIDSQPNLKTPLPAWPTLTSLEIREPAKGTVRDAAELGDTLILEGGQLAGDTVTAVFNHRLLSVPREKKVEAESTAQRVEIKLPKASDGTASADWPAGKYSVFLRIERTGKAPRQTNERLFALAPRISAAPVVTGTAASPSVTIQVFPIIRPQQRVEFYVGGEPFKPGAIAAPTASLTVAITGVTRIDGPIPVSLRVDGIDSLLVRDPSAAPPQFDPKQTITLPP